VSDLDIKYFNNYFLLQELYASLREKDMMAREYVGYPDPDYVFIIDTYDVLKIHEIATFIESLKIKKYAILVGDRLTDPLIWRQLLIMKPKGVIGLDLINYSKHEIEEVPLDDIYSCPFINSHRYISLHEIKTKKEAFYRSILTADINYLITSISENNTN